MRRATHLLLALPLALGAGLLFLSAQAREQAGGPPRARAWTSACRGKPLAPIGELSLSVVERPLSDEAVIRADWRCGAVGEGCQLSLLLPEGATLLEGEADQALPEGLEAGACTWRVRFPTRCTSDLTLRLGATVDGASCSREAYVRLWECE